MTAKRSEFRAAAVGAFYHTKRPVLILQTNHHCCAYRIMDKKELLKSFNPPEQHFSGLENDAMKLQGCSLLVPRDVWYEAGPVNLSPHVFKLEWISLPTFLVVNLSKLWQTRKSGTERTKRAQEVNSCLFIWPLPER